MTTFNQSGLFFVPKSWQRANAVRWLKRIHAWTGFWGALLFLMMGTSGFLLNHRAVLKIDTGKPIEVSAMQVAVPAGSIADEEALGRWAKSRLGLKGEGRAPPKEGGRGKPEFMGRALPEAKTWARVYNLPDTRVTVEHVPGSNAVSVKREAVGVLGTIKNLHKGTGVSVAWVLLIDTIAGALIAMSLTGFLLWSRLHGTRLLAGALAGGSLAWALAASIPSFG